MAKDKKKDKKKKEKKSKRHRRDVESEATRKAADVDVEVDGGNNTLAPIPIKLSTGIASSNSTAANNGGGWSWGAAFSAASQVQPNEDDLDDNFLKATAASDGGSNKGITGISQLANDHAVHKHVSNGTDSVHGTQENKTKRKRSESASSIQSDDDGSDKDSEEDVPLEGRMVDVDGDMSLVLVDKISGNIYSSGEIQDDGKRLVIGKLVNGEVQLDSSVVEQMKQSDEGDEPSFPYETNADDHCETPLQSYKDILPLLNEMCNKSFGGKKESMKIYDPYFCDGSVIKHLSSLGYSNVHNKKDDCYAVWESKSEPEFDVFLTNPPYSEDHIENLMNFVTSSEFGRKPWLLLMPQWVHKKDYYINATTKNGKRSCNPFYIVPKKRYVYLPPANFREKKDSDTHKKSSPFVSMWFCWGGSEKRNGELMNAFHKSAVASECDLARSKSALRDLRRSGSSKSKKSKKTRTSK